MKRIRYAVIAISVVFLGLIGYAMSNALSTERPVGFQQVQAQTPDGHTFAVAIWYPTEARPRPTTLLQRTLMNVAPNGPVSGRDLPLVVLSHGSGGGLGSHADLALALSNAGYVVAAPLHLGDNFRDQSALGSLSWLADRTRQLSAAVDYMLTQWQASDHIDSERIGAYGFSAGALTVLSAAGAQPDLHLIARHCAQTPEFICGQLREANSPLLDPANLVPQEESLLDARIRAASIAAPGLGFTFGADAMTNVRVPVQVWSADKDTYAPYATNARPVREALGAQAEFHAVPGAGHFSFVAPCGPFGPSFLCAEQGSFDRKAFHRDMNAKVVTFFDKHLN